MENLASLLQGLGDPVRDLVRHLLEKSGQGVEKGLSVRPGVENHLISAERGKDIGKAVLHIHGFAGSERIGQLAFVEVEDRGRAATPPQGFQIRKRHEARGNHGLIGFGTFDRP
jgi:hypothetical protein